MLKNILLICFAISFSSTHLLAHGIESQIIQGVGLLVKYDTGEPMVGAQVKIYAPANYKKTYAILKTNKQGKFLFTPTVKGTWIVLVSDGAGHGVRKEIVIKNDLSVLSTPTNQINLAQKLLMALCVVWGFVGMAFFFYKKEKTT